MTRRLLFILLTTLLIGTSTQAAKFQWLPIDPEDLTATSSPIDPNADSEYLYRFQQIKSGGTDYEIEEYVRIKIYSAKGVDRFGKINLLYENNDTTLSPKDIKARIIKPDGSIVSVDPKNFFERDVIRYDGWSVRARSFAFPSLEVGSIIEYRYAAEFSNRLLFSIHLELLKDIPTRTASFKIFPPHDTALIAKGGASIPEGMEKSDESKKNFGFIPLSAPGKSYAFTLKNLPAFEKEPFMPPETEVRPHLIFDTLYSDIWEWTDENLNEGINEYLKPSRKSIAELSKKITAGASTPEEKITAISSYCRTNFRSCDPDAGQFTKAELAKLKTNEDLSDFLKHKYGLPRAITMAFVGLARAAGLEAHIAICNDTRFRFFSENDKGVTHYPPANVPFFEYIVAVKIDNQWRFYDPGAAQHVPGQLSWFHQGTHAFIVRGKKKYEWVVTPGSSANLNKSIQNGTFTLSTDGTLEGDASIEYTGHTAAQFRLEHIHETDEALAKTLTESIENNLVPGAKVTNLNIQNLRSPEHPIALSYHVRSPHYAESTDQRLFITPAFFQKGKTASFPNPVRKFHIRFPFPWSEESNITITLPEGFTMEAGTAPISLPKNTAYTYQVDAAVRPATRQLFFTRSFAFNHTLMNKESYPSIKRIFDHVHHQDSHAITLKRSSPPPTTAATSSQP